jgi:hypothetical protein
MATAKIKKSSAIVFVEKTRVLNFFFIKKLDGIIIESLLEVL